VPLSGSMFCAGLNVKITKSHSSNDYANIKHYAQSITKKK
jgi:hypothetical protein